MASEGICSLCNLEHAVCNAPLQFAAYKHFNEIIRQNSAEFPCFYSNELQGPRNNTSNPQDANTGWSAYALLNATALPRRSRKPLPDPNLTPGLDDMRSSNDMDCPSLSTAAAVQKAVPSAKARAVACQKYLLQIMRASSCAGQTSKPGGGTLNRPAELIELRAFGM